MPNAVNVTLTADIGKNVTRGFWLDKMINKSLSNANATLNATKAAAENSTPGGNKAGP